MKKTIALLLALALLAALPLLAGCKKPDASLQINVMTLNGTTGFGMAPLMENAKNGTAALNYNFTVETDPTLVRDALINGSADIGAVPTNLAAALYNATKGEILLLALNTKGVLYLVTNANVEAPASLADLAGKTVYCPTQNPAFITKALLEKAEIADVVLDSTTYAQPANLQAAVAQGTVDYAILPEPMVTIAQNKAATQGVTLTVALDLTAEWDKYFPAGSLVQGCVVARRSFVEEHPLEIEKFLEEYEASIHYVTENPEAASEMIVSAGIFAQAPVAKVAIPKCNLTFTAGSEMKTAMAAFLAAMPPSSVGNALPGDDFYFGA